MPVRAPRALAAPPRLRSQEGRAWGACLGVHGGKRVHVQRAGAGGAHVRLAHGRAACKRGTRLSVAPRRHRPRAGPCVAAARAPSPDSVVVKGLPGIGKPSSAEATPARAARHAPSSAPAALSKRRGARRGAMAALLATIATRRGERNGCGSGGVRSGGEALCASGNHPKEGPAAVAARESDRSAARQTTLTTGRGRRRRCRWGRARAGVAWARTRYIQA